ncbi:hypothetical protein HYPSUDRAFT_528815 [Hypholoma sublateritium FD-334 SS-4]|uniref:Uncharacterized protein n=1 Tax=Hypholoma sublateritium (strain FD-334 SS-4) TaxID=945553 RepID=A0A0D2PYE0_HYPSF|nr:hypothetical protein HYPSUDRAFT_528815 [Hypholoma sublateritium FD-334 SS-4]
MLGGAGLLLSAAPNACAHSCDSNVLSSRHRCVLIPLLLRPRLPVLPYICESAELRVVPLARSCPRPSARGGEASYLPHLMSFAFRGPARMGGLQWKVRCGDSRRGPGDESFFEFSYE